MDEIDILDEIDFDDLEQYVGTSVEDTKEIKAFLADYSNLDVSKKVECIKKLDNVFNIINFRINRSEENFYIEAFERMLKEDSYALTNNAYVSHLYQAAQKGKMEIFGFTKEQTERVLNVAKDLIPVEEKIDMSLYDSYVDGLEDMEHIMMEAFVEKLKAIKNKGQRIPEKYCDYLFKLKLEKKLPEGKYDAIFERAYEDKAGYYLMKSGIDQRYVIHVSQEESENENGIVAGEATPDGAIYFNRDIVLGLSKYNLSSLYTLFHECQHAKQFAHIDNMISAKEYTMLKEYYVRKAFGQTYYEENYQYNHAEIDANVIANKEVARFMEGLGFSKNDYSLIGDGEENYKEEQKELIGRYNKDNNVRIYNGVEVDINELFEQTLQIYPFLLDKYKVLQLEFNSDGKRKNRADLLLEYDRMLREIMQDKNSQEKSNISYMSTIMKSGHRTEPKILIEELEQLIDYEPANSKMEQYLNRIVETGALNLYMNAMEDGKVELGSDEINEDKEKNFIDLERKLMEFSAKHPGTRVSRILRGEEILEENEEDLGFDLDFDLDFLENDGLNELIGSLNSETLPNLNLDEELDRLAGLYEATSMGELSEGRSAIINIKDSKTNIYGVDDYDFDFVE